MTGRRKRRSKPARDGEVRVRWRILEEARRVVVTHTPRAERVPGEGRRPGPRKPAFLTGRRWTKGLATIQMGTSRQRADLIEAVATEGVSGGSACSAAVEQAAVGRRFAEEPEIAASPEREVLDGTAFQPGAASGSRPRAIAWNARLAGCSEAKAGGSPSSEAPPDEAGHGNGKAKAARNQGG
jgi:hypothetical protein